ncbi:MAG: hypothetical protein PF569_00845 [Candidatus Woesearchaeota archaeon]|jgi:hypothetical protein|nr:hypothetical protein [Candidatus Woesearchaeota archaeon]
MALTISQSDYEYVLSILGYPLIDPTTVSLPYNQTTIENYAILPAMKEYFKWFPIREIQSIAIGAGAEGIVEFPDDFTYSVVHHAFTSQADTLGNNYPSGNPFVTQMSVMKSSYSSFGTRYNYGMNSITGSLKSADDVQRNSNRITRFDTDETNRVVTYFCNEPGYVDIEWAKWSEDFNKIPWNKQKEVLELAQAETLLWVVRVLSQSNPELPTEFNYDDMRTEGEDIKKRLLIKWKEYTKAVAIR